MPKTLIDLKPKSILDGQIGQFCKVVYGGDSDF